MERNVTYLLRKLTTEQRAALAERLGISDDTLTRRINNPAGFSLDDAPVLVNFLNDAHGIDHDGYDLLFGYVKLSEAVEKPINNPVAA